MMHETVKPIRSWYAPITYEQDKLTHAHVCETCGGEAYNRITASRSGVTLSTYVFCDRHSRQARETYTR